MYSLSTKQGGAVKQSEFRRWLAAKGAEFSEGANHTRVRLNGKTTYLPRHGSHEIGEVLRQKILKQLGLK
jgi:mRNA interferase HicA